MALPCIYEVFDEHSRHPIHGANVKQTITKAIEMVCIVVELRP